MISCPAVLMNHMFTRRSSLAAMACALAACSATPTGGSAVAGGTDGTGTAAMGEKRVPASCPAEITLQQACEMAMKYHPDLQAMPWDRRVADARRVAATRLPNPSLQLEAEDFGGTGEVRDSRAAIYTASLVQAIETGGKRAARAAMAGASASANEAEYAVRRREVLAETSQRYVDAMAARETLDLAERELAVAKEALASVQTQVEVGRATDSEQRQAALVVTRAELDQRKARRQADQSLTALASQWGCPNTRPSRVAGRLGNPPASLPGRAGVKQALDSHPALAAARSRQQELDAALRLARAGRNPDVELSVGTRHFNSNDEDAFVVGASVPLPLFHNQQAEIREAEAEAAKARLAADAERLKLANRFEEAWTELANSHDEAVTVSSTLLPGAREVFEKTREPFDLGSVSFLEFLEARRSLNTATHRWLEARRDYHRAAANLQALTGRPL